MKLLLLIFVAKLSETIFVALTKNIFLSFDQLYILIFIIFIV